MSHSYGCDTQHPCADRTYSSGLERHNLEEMLAFYKNYDFLCFQIKTQFLLSQIRVTSEYSWEWTIILQNNWERVTVWMFVLKDSWTWDWKWEHRKCKAKAGAYTCSGAPTVLARCPGTVGSLLGAAFLAVKAERALCHSWGAVLPNCLISTTLSSISLLTAPLQLENANKAWFSCQISGNHIAPGTAQCESLWRGCCAKRDSVCKTSTKPGHLPWDNRPACLCPKPETPKNHMYRDKGEQKWPRLPVKPRNTFADSFQTSLKQKLLNAPPKTLKSKLSCDSVTPTVEHTGLRQTSAAVLRARQNRDAWIIQATYFQHESVRSKITIL